MLSGRSGCVGSIAGTCGDRARVRRQPADQLRGDRASCPGCGGYRDCHGYRATTAGSGVDGRFRTGSPSGEPGGRQPRQPLKTWPAALFVGPIPRREPPPVSQHRHRGAPHRIAVRGALTVPARGRASLRDQGRAGTVCRRRLSSSNGISSCNQACRFQPARRLITEGAHRRATADRPGERIPQQALPRPA